jgi:thiol-disulfide isomerase/thioredoxin
MVRIATAAIALAASLIGVTARAQQLQLLDFWSPQCGPCMQMKPIVHSFEQAGYPIRTVDTTRDGQLSQQYGVSQIPCFVMLVNGRETERQVGAIGSDGLTQMFARANTEALRQIEEARLKEGVRGQSPDRASLPRPDASTRNAAAGPAQPPADQASATKNAVPVETPVPAANGNLASGAGAPASHAALLSATVRLIIEDPTGRSYGTGTVVDTRSGEALVVTCAHLFRETKGKAPVKADLYEAAGDGVRLAGHATGQVLSYDLTRDIALVSLRVDRPVGVANVAPPNTIVQRFDRMISIGCSNGQDPTVLETRVNKLDRYQGPPNIEASGAPAIGRSGGGLFNGKNELVGVCNNADPEGNEGIYAGLESIHDQLDRLGLKEIYAKSDSSGRSAETAPGAGLSGGPPLVRGQEPSITPLPNDSSKSPAGGIAAGGQVNSAAPARNLSETEKAALEEIMSRAVSSEVIFIVRPKDGNGQCEVIHMDSVSPEFLRALRQRSAPPTTTR